MDLFSKSFENCKQIPSEFTCDSINISPELHWQNAPSGTKSFALVMSDPDAPRGTFYHWLVCNIPATVSSFPKAALLQNGIRQLKNDAGSERYFGPCPPSGTHRYYFRLYALDVEKLDCSARQELLREIEKHKLATAELMCPYARQH